MQCGRSLYCVIDASVRGVRRTCHTGPRVGAVVSSRGVLQTLLNCVVARSRIAVNTRNSYFS